MEDRSGRCGLAGGDTDANGSVDLDDHTDLEVCLLGPGGGLGIDCNCFDFDHDGDVTLKDFGGLQAAFGD